MTDPVDVRYLFRMTDDTGMFQHAVLGVPDPTEGYTTDDNARALILAAMLYQRSPEKQYEDLMVRYLSFLLYAEKDRWFRNFMGYDRNFIEKRGSEDCFGRSLLSLGFIVSRKSLPQTIRGCSERLLNRTVSSCSSLTYLKGKAYSLIGLTLWDDSSTQPFIKMLRESVVDTYVQCRREDWCWFEDEITYCSAILPLALFCAYEKDSPEVKIALESLDFLLKHTIKDDIFQPVGCKGWLKRGSKAAVYDEQPVEACNTMLACLKAYELTDNEQYRTYAKKCFFWYLGHNISNLSLINSETGGCRDGLTHYGFNENEGAESIVCWLISALIAEKEHWYPSA